MRILRLHELYKHTDNCYNSTSGKVSELAIINVYVKIIMKYHNPFTIIVADDDSEDRELFRELFLHHEDFTLLGCLTSGIEVFDEISRKKNVPDVLLIDMYMPFFTGLDVVKALEKLNAAPMSFKFVISTAESIPEMEILRNNPYIIFIKKPVTTEEIKALPNLLLEHLRQRLSRVS